MKMYLSATSRWNFDVEAKKLLISLGKLKSKIKSKKQEDDVEDYLEAAARPLHRPKSWWMISMIFLNHASGLYGAYLALWYVSWAHLAYALVMTELSILGASVGVHRYYSHKSFKATIPLQIVLMVLQTMSNMDSIYRWVREHRMHHKYVDTDADPMNAKNGFWFSHWGWIMVKKHPMVKFKGRGINLDDLDADPIVMFQKRHYPKLWFLFNVVVPMIFPVYVLGESVWNAFYVSACFRAAFTDEALFLLNSWCHFFGNKEYDKNNSSTNSFLMHILSSGEGYHNYHHAFPMDYRASEYDGDVFNVAAAFIEMWAYIGWAYDLKKPSPELVAARTQRTGDGTHSTSLIKAK